MRTGKIIFGVLLMCLMAGGAYAAAKDKKPAAAQAPAPVASGEGQIVIGENLSAGMPLSQAIQLLGIPDQVRVIRGTSADRDSIQITYVGHGLVVRALSGGTTVEGIEITPSFKGVFKSENGIKLGVKYEMLIGEYGLPTSLTAQVMRYPDRNLYFQLNNERLLSAKNYAPNSKLLDARLMNP